MTVLHEHGIDPASVEFCGCTREGKPSTHPVRVDDATQILQAGFWPASWEEPRTMFTLEVMREFQILANTASVNARDFISSLEIRSDNVDPLVTAVSLELL